MLAWIVTATSFSFVMVQLDITIVNVALPRIGEELHNGVDTLQWIVDAYTLAFVVLLLSGGHGACCTDHDHRDPGQRGTPLVRYRFGSTQCGAPGQRGHRCSRFWRVGGGGVRSAS